MAAAPSRLSTFGATDLRQRCDAALIESAKCGHRDSFDEICRRYLPRVYRLAVKLGGAAYAEDAMQEVMVRAWANLAKFRAGADLWPWLAMITRNVVIDEFRHLSRETPTTDEAINNAINHRGSVESAAETTVQLDEATALRRNLLRALQELPQRDRTFVWLRLVEDDGLAAIAANHATTEHGVRNVVWRARKLLMSALQPAHERWDAPAAVFIFTRFLRRIRNGLRAFSDRVQRSGIAILPLGEAGSVLLGYAAVIAFTAVSLPGGINPRDATRTESDLISPDRAVAVDASSPELVRHSELPTSSRSIGPLVVSRTSGNTKPNHLAPESSTLTVRVVGPDGKTAYSYETDYTCDGNGAELIPEGSPVTAVC